MGISTTFSLPSRKTSDRYDPAQRALAQSARPEATGGYQRAVAAENTIQSSRSSVFSPIAAAALRFFAETWHWSIIQTWRLPSFSEVFLRLTKLPQAGPASLSLCSKKPSPQYSFDAARWNQVSREAGIDLQWKNQKAQDMQSHSNQVQLRTWSMPGPKLHF